MKTRIMTNKEKNSYRLDIIDKDQLESYYFKTKKEALDFQSFTINLNKYNKFI
jgi:hypothetical protein